MSSACNPGLSHSNSSPEQAHPALDRTSSEMSIKSQAPFLFDKSAASSSSSLATTPDTTPDKETNTGNSYFGQIESPCNIKRGRSTPNAWSRDQSIEPQKAWKPDESVQIFIGYLMLFLVLALPFALMK